MSELKPEDKKLHKALNKAMKENRGFFDTILEAAQAKRIEQLQAELDLYRWIPVSERLPDAKGLYLVLWYNSNNGNTQLRTCIEYIFDKKDDWGFTQWKPIILPESEVKK